MKSVLVAAGVTALVLAIFVGVRATAADPPPVQRIAAEPDGMSYQRESIRMMTWNICGEAGGTRGSESYCAWRARPQAKAAAIETIVRQRDLNVVMLQEACFPDPANGRGGDLNDLAPLMAALGPEWTYRTAVVARPDTTSHCRGGDLIGTVGEVIAVRGTIASSTVTPLLVAGDPDYYPDATTKSSSNLLCVRVDGWWNTPCVVHLLHTSGPEFVRETASLTYKLGGIASPVLGGDLNTSQGEASSSPLRPLYNAYPECDQQAYVPGDTVDEATHYTSKTEAPTPDAEKLDYIFAPAGFASCDSLTEFADGGANVPSADDPAGLSDHAPVVAVTRGRTLTWKFDEPDGLAVADASGNGITGTLHNGVTRSNERGGSLRFDGTGTVISDTDTLNRFDTRRSFTVSVWAKPDPGTPTGTLMRQRGNAIPPINLSYASGQWRFALATDDVANAAVDQVSVPAQPDVWTHLVATYDAAQGRMSLFVNGSLAGTAAHTERVPSGVRLTVGRAWHGAIDDLQLFSYALTSTEITQLRAAQAAR